MSGITSSPWLSRRRRVGLSALFLTYLVYVGIAVPGHSHGAGEALAYVLLGVFAATYLVLADRSPALSDPVFLALVALLFGLMVAELPFARAIAFTLSLYVTAVITTRFGVRALPAVAALALLALLVPPAITSWHVSLGDSLGYVTPIAVPVVAIASLSIRRINVANVELAQARAEVAQLSAEAERVRIARDLHDLLGHSLTTITVKAGLAHRLGAGDPSRALREIAEVEQLARTTLQEVRAAVAGYREVTLAGELAAGRELLRGAGIVAQLPSAVDVVDGGHQELFGWVVREGLTNVVRHARAASCTVRLSATSLEILDDGLGDGQAPALAEAPAPREAAGGSGLNGLRERVGAAGGVLEAGPRGDRGWMLRVTLQAAR